MATVTKEVFMFWRTNENGGEMVVADFDFSSLNNYTLLAKKTVEFDIGGFDSRIAEIEHLEAAVDKIRAQSQSKINLLLDRISNLKAIGCDQ